MDARGAEGRGRGPGEEDGSDGHRHGPLAPSAGLIPIHMGNVALGGAGGANHVDMGGWVVWSAPSSPLSRKCY